MGESVLSIIIYGLAFIAWILFSVAIYKALEPFAKKHEITNKK